MEYKPLLQPGFHDIQFNEINNHFLKDFSNSKTRPKLIKNLQEFVETLLSLVPKAELWLDGSFTTEKENPNDIDLVVLMSESTVNSISDEHKRYLSILLNNQTAKRKYGLDVYFCTAEDKKMRSYWTKWFGNDRNDNPKGIARVVV